MKIGHITKPKDAFYYENEERFSKNKFIIAIKENRYGSRYDNIKPLIFIENKHLSDLDSDQFSSKIQTKEPPYKNTHNIPDLPLSRFHTNELIKIDNEKLRKTGNENPNSPQFKTYNANVSSLNVNQIIEIFEGTIKEAESLFTPKYPEFFEIIEKVYLENKNCFFIIENNQLIGPFHVQQINGESFHIEKDNFEEFGKYELNDNSYIEFEENNLVRKIYVPGVNRLSLNFIEGLEFISDAELIDNFKNDLKNNKEYFNDVNLNNALKVLRKAIGKSPLNSKNNKRLKELLNKGEESLLKDIDLMNNIPEIKLLKEKKLKIEEELLESTTELEKTNNKKKEAREEKEDLEEKKSSLKNEIKDLEKTKETELKNKKSKLDSEIKNLEEEKENLKLEVSEERISLERENNAIKEVIKVYGKEETELKNQIENLQEKFKGGQLKAQQTLENLIESKIHFDFISGRDLSKEKDKQEKYKNFQIENTYTENQYNDFRNEVVAILKNNNREFEKHFIDNLLISIYQNTLTVFAGVPGTGKTTLARLLTSILSPKEKIREVSVNKGWSSQKDLIGYVNPLSKKFQSSSTDIFSLLKQMDYEESENQSLNTPMSYVVLDEANLSPLEHYWSSFYNLTDSSGMLEIKLGHDEEVKFPNNLRFIGTINYDHTTEELSPRVLDRINIIQLNKANDIGFDSVKKEAIDNINITFQRCQDYFEIAEKKELSEKNIKNIEVFNEIKNEFRKLKIFISPRVEIGIKKYIIIASEYMSDVNKPFDYCIAQRLLPLINLQGDENKQKLKVLKTFLENKKYDLSIKILDNILAIGAENGMYEDNYNYFLTLSNV
ncbi:AAA family ATPase [Tenacibaculum finnmarkense genomovar ulcerans]|uniref:AAA family ATPase n=1 Tax=Tenacibaculum finnmarkense TaxID=2781243 RepID=UPI001E418041|nr:AAA family ATPase [Tenacibaculum finnmarkense]MCD8431230.1 AAA family ATPase [Tenacibaculum finnmarkense genomovar ulcerans]MCG8748694.1 AAA domain-containing protein [Tenacibaculum finnmarkense]MCG8753410.1 AAA domain-containing protein [Tenacibaculum finnmarkense]MCG8782347.1 AAA domain-containing protein [Tenacibaculum finnmarkense]MCG8801891.1 AAA domain-containing protein [Tenacibaculum finnmarkense]